MFLKNKLRVGIAGYGIVGNRRRCYIDANSFMQTVAICDQKFTATSKPIDGARCFHDYRDLLKQDLDVLFVSLPNYLAPEVTIAGLKKGLHVFCEKPPGRTVDDVKDVMKEKSKRPEQVVKYGFNHRYHDSVRQALAIVASGELGRVLSLRGIYGKSKVVPFDGNWRSERKYAGGGILLDQGIHMVDLIRLFCDDIVEVKSFISNDFWKHDVEDNAYALMKDKKGRIAMLHSSATQWQHCFSLEITLEKGYLELQGILSGTKSYGEEKLIIGKRSSASTGSESLQVVRYLEDNSWRDEVDDFARCIINKKKVDSGTLEDAYSTMQLVYRIYCADEQWRKLYKLKA
jgi:predicted dehydrogenase